MVRLLVFDREQADNSYLPKELEKFSERIIYINNTLIKASSSEIRSLPFYRMGKLHFLGSFKIYRKRRTLWI